MLATARGQGRYVNVWGRLRDDVTRDQATIEMAGIARQLEAAMLRRIATAEGYRSLIAPVQRRLAELCTTLEAALRDAVRNPEARG